MSLKVKKLSTSGLVLMLLVLILIIGIASTIAYIAFKTPKLTNEFVPAKVTCKVEETFESGIKSNVRVRNTGNVSAYIRVAVVVNWVNDIDGTVLSDVPKESEDYVLVLGDSAWKKGSDGYFYYSHPVQVNAVTPILISKAEQIKSPGGYSLSIQVLASAIQSEPPKAVQEVWDVEVNNGVLTPF